MEDECNDLREAIMQELIKRLPSMNETALECIYLWICRA